MRHMSLFIYIFMFIFIFIFILSCLVRWLRCRSDVLVCPCIGANAASVTWTPYRIDHSIHLQYIWRDKMICINWMSFCPQEIVSMKCGILNLYLVLEKSKCKSAMLFLCAMMICKNGVSIFTHWELVLLTNMWI